MSSQKRAHFKIWGFFQFLGNTKELKKKELAARHPLNVRGIREAEQRSTSPPWGAGPI